MAQAPLSFNLKNPNTNALVAGSLDGQATSLLTGQGLLSKLNVTTASVVKTGAGRVVRVLSISATSFTLNDCLTTSAAAASNEVYTSGTIAAGAIITLDFPLTTGLVVSAIAGGAIAISYT